MARLVFLMYDAEDRHDTADEQTVADQFRRNVEVRPVMEMPDDAG